jgi:hypothetical protein
MLTAEIPKDCVFDIIAEIPKHRVPRALTRDFETC